MANTPMSPKVVVLGSCMIDFVSYASRLPEPGETLRGKRFRIGFGGKGADQCIVLAKLGAPTAVIARVGDDYYGQKYIQIFKDHELDISHVHTTHGVFTGTATIIVTDNGQNHIVTTEGVNSYVSIEDVRRAEKLIQQADVVVCSFEVPLTTTIEALKIKKQNEGITILNGAPPLPRQPDPEIFKYVDVLCVNETESEALTGLRVENVSDAAESISKLLEKGSQMVIITMGENGAAFASQENRKVVHVPGIAVKAVDTTGAGDAFIGAFTYFLFLHPYLPMKEIVRRACVVASYSVQAEGTHDSYPYKKDLPTDLFE